MGVNTVEGYTAATGTLNFTLVLCCYEVYRRLGDKTIDVGSTGVLLIGPIFVEHTPSAYQSTSSDNPSKHICLTVINCV